MTEQHGHFHRPSVDDFIFEGERTPLLLRRPVLIGIVVGFLALVVSYFLIARALGLSTNIDAKPFKDWIDERGYWAPVAFIGIMALSVLFAPIPNIPIFIAAGLAWGPWLGTVYSMAGMMLGSVLAFYVSRWLGRRHLSRLIGGKAAQRVDSLVDHMGGRLIFAARMLPVVNFDWISFVAGLTSMRFPVFFFWSFLGLLLPTTIAVVAGDRLDDDIRISFALAGLWIAGIVVSALYFWYRRYRYRALRRQAAEARASPAAD